MPLLNINNALQQVLQAMIVSIYLNSQLLPFLKGTLNYGWEQTMLSDGNISIKEQIVLLRNAEFIAQSFRMLYQAMRICVI